MAEGMHLTPIGDGMVLLEPGDGLDPTDPDAYLESMLAFLQEQGARRLIYDMKKAPVIDEVYYGWLERVARLCRVANIEMVVVNMGPPAAFALALQLQGEPPFLCDLDVDRARARLL